MDGLLASFRSGLASIALVHRVQVDEPMFALYWRAVSDLPGDALVASLGAALRELDTFPKPAHLRRLALAWKRAQRDREDAERSARRVLTATKWAYVLAELADPEVPEPKKAVIRERWRQQNPSENPPWEGAASPW